MAKQQLLSLMTYHHGFHADVYNPGRLLDGNDISNTTPKRYKTPAEAIGDGWRLLGHPLHWNSPSIGQGCWEWLLEKYE